MKNNDEGAIDNDAERLLPDPEAEPGKYVAEIERLTGKWGQMPIFEVLAHLDSRDAALREARAEIDELAGHYDRASIQCDELREEFQHTSDEADRLVAALREAREEVERLKRGPVENIGYQRLFNAIGDAIVDGPAGGVAISVQRFKESLARSQPATPSPTDELANMLAREVERQRATPSPVPPECYPDCDDPMCPLTHTGSSVRADDHEKQHGHIGSSMTPAPGNYKAQAAVGSSPADQIADALASDTPSPVPTTDDLKDIALDITAKIGAAAKDGLLSISWPLVYNALVEVRGSSVRADDHEVGQPSPEMLPCPFCGSANVEVFSNDDKCFNAECQNCEAVGPNNLCLPRERALAKAVEEWNRRVTSPAAVAADSTPPPLTDDPNGREDASNGLVLGQNRRPPPISLSAGGDSTPPAVADEHTEQARALLRDLTSKSHYGRNGAVDRVANALRESHLRGERAGLERAAAEFPGIGPALRALLPPATPET